MKTCIKTRSGWIVVQGTQGFRTLERLTADRRTTQMGSRHRKLLDYGTDPPSDPAVKLKQYKLPGCEDIDKVDFGVAVQMNRQPLFRP
jgi:hypothetical protein